MPSLVFKIYPDNEKLKPLLKAGFSLFILIFFLFSPLIPIFENNNSAFRILLNKNVIAQEDSNQTNLDPVEERRLLEEELKKLEEQIVQTDEDLSRTEKEKNTLNNQISILNKEISKLNLQIQQSNLMIKDITIQISDTGKSIEKTSFEIEDSKDKLANILRTIYEEDKKSLLEILFTEKELSDFFDHLVALETLNSKNQELLKGITDLKSYLEDQKQSLDGEKTDLEKVVAMQTLQKKDSESTKKQKDTLFKLTEVQYQQYLKQKEESEKRRAEIKARIFDLIGVPQAPTFGEAYELAKEISAITRVRPALLLAVLTQESNIGKNVGQCYLTNIDTGEGVRAESGKVESRTMSPTRDVPHFLSICQELGRNHLNTLVSCPMSYGWGGAMGPAQFIPSTWVLYRDKVKAITGKAADPWDIKDAFLAAALYLSKYGATDQTYNSEWKAAMIYFSGTTNTKYRFYGDSVMKIATQYEQDIKDLEGSS